MKEYINFFQNNNEYNVEMISENPRKSKKISPTNHSIPRAFPFAPPAVSHAVTITFDTPLHTRTTHDPR